nr:water-soluble peptide [Papaver somniferum]
GQIPNQSPTMALGSNVTAGQK